MYMTRPFLALSAMLIVAGSLSVAASAPQAAGGPPAEAAPIAEFHQAIANYMALRGGLRNEVRGPVKDSTSSQLNNASDALAGAIQRARVNAQVGAIFSEPVAAIIKRRIADAVRTEKLRSALADIDDEGATASTPKVHLRLPVSEQLATMPPSLLVVLPPLPKELEYRILGRHLVLRDVDASIIVDYIPAAVPR
jgi:hypothetical protein